MRERSVTVISTVDGCRRHERRRADPRRHRPRTSCATWCARPTRRRARAARPTTPRRWSPTTTTTTTGQATRPRPTSRVFDAFAADLGRGVRHVGQGRPTAVRLRRAPHDLDLSSARRPGCGAASTSRTAASRSTASRPTTRRAPTPTSTPTTSPTWTRPRSPTADAAAGLVATAHRPAGRPVRDDPAARPDGRPDAVRLLSASARDAAEGRSVFSAANGATRIGEKLSPHPAAAVLRSVLPRVWSARRSRSSSRPDGACYSVFDNGFPTGPTDWVADGTLTNLIAQPGLRGAATGSSRTRRSRT